MEGAKRGIPNTGEGAAAGPATNPPDQNAGASATNAHAETSRPQAGDRHHPWIAKTAATTAAAAHKV